MARRVLIVKKLGGDDRYQCRFVTVGVFLGDRIIDGTCSWMGLAKMEAKSKLITHRTPSSKQPRRLYRFGYLNTARGFVKLRNSHFRKHNDARVRLRTMS